MTATHTRETKWELASQHKVTDSLTLFNDLL